MTCRVHDPSTMDDRTVNNERLAAAHATLTAAIGAVTTGAEWQQLLHLARSFHRYSPNNQLLLAAQGADGLVASFNTWKTITATDGQPCRVRKGETALRVYAPMQSVRRELDPATGEEVEVRGRVRFKLVPVFHQGQLVTPPDLPLQPRFLEGTEPPPDVWEAVADQIDAGGFRLERGPLDGPGGPNGITDHTTRTVTVRDDLPPVQALKTQLHELAHVMLHDGEQRDGMTRDRIEVEAESVAYVVLDTLGVDSADYSIPYVTNWAGGDIELVRSTAERVLGAARTIIDRLEATLDIELIPNPLSHAQPSSPQPATVDSGRPAPGVSVDRVVAEHLSHREPSWPQLAAHVPAIEADRARAVEHDIIGQAIVLAEAGASASATASYLHAHQLTLAAVEAVLTTPVVDALGEHPTLYPTNDDAEAVRHLVGASAVQKRLVEDLVAAITRNHPARHQPSARSSRPERSLGQDLTPSDPAWGHSPSKIREPIAGDRDAEGTVGRVIQFPNQRDRSSEPSRASPRPPTGPIA